jgi:vacuolar protein sorting-associated protein 13A/C
MFEKLVEKILLKKLGNFISGLDNESLKIAVWQGDITLNNVHLSPDSLLRLQLPFILTFGIISKLVIRVPWSRLTSSPIEINLDGLYVFLSPQEKKNWEYSEEGEIMKRKDMLESFEKKPEEVSREEEIKQKGFIEKLTGKILDNIKITIKNIHIKLEYDLEGRNFGVGVCLESIESYTTDENWEKHFTDRHEVKTADLSIYKLLKITGFSIYWNSFLDNRPKDDLLVHLRESIFLQHDYLISPSNL